MKTKMYIGILIYLISNGSYAYDPMKTLKVDKNPNIAPQRQIDKARKVQIPPHSSSNYTKY
jgi:hypothetical protein